MYMHKIPVRRFMTCCEYTLYLSQLDIGVLGRGEALKLYIDSAQGKHRN